LLRILMVAPEQIPVPGGGSVEICMLAIAKQLAKHHQVTIVSRQSSHRKSTSRMGNLMIVRVASGSSKRYIASVLQYMKGKSYDLIQVDNRPHYMAKIKSAYPRTPISLFLHSLTFVPRTKAVAASLQKANMIIANSSSLKKNLSRMFPKVKHKIRMVHLGVDVSRFNSPSKAQKMKSKRRYDLGRSFTILFVGRIIPRKGVPVLIKAAQKISKKIPRTKLIIVGKGKKGYVQRLKSQAKRMHVATKFMGKIGHGKIHHVYRMADCFVCPSQKHEAFGLVNVEAMASGVPVVASNIGGIKEIVKHNKNGFLIKRYHSSDAFAEYIKKIAADRSLGRRLGKQGRATVLRKFSWANTAAKLNRIYLRKS
jgi:spore coat protein SA